VKVTDLTLGYGQRRIIHNVDLDVPSGALTAIVGPNGSGKSTLLRGMARLLRPTTGTVHLDGVDIAELGHADLARQLALLPQAPVTPSGLTVGDLVARGRFPHRSWFQRWSDRDEAAVRDALGQVGLLERAQEHVSELSGGQRQRAWIAMVLAQDTDHLLLDEPTTFLDLAHAVDVMTLARTVVAHRSGRTVVCVLHDLTLAARFADHLVVVSEGRIAAAGAPGDVLTAARLDAVFGLSAEVLDVDGAPAVVPVHRR
jgi:iron complex transport system ATP-binding protein